MTNCKILTRDMLNHPVDVAIEGAPLDYCRAKQTADGYVRRLSGEAMLLAWYDRKAAAFSPRVE